jgi:2-haloacid dehalogenase
MSAPGWITFDCYGTLVDWNRGITAAMESVAPGRGAELRALYERVEPEVQAERPFRRYREVLAEGLRRSARIAGVELAAGDDRALAASLPEWPVFDDVGPSLGALHDAGYRLAVLSNVDPDLFAATRERLPVEIDLVVTAADVESYKPGLAHFERFRELSGAIPGEWVHTARSWFHDIVPAHRLGVPSVWVNRDHGSEDPGMATVVIPDLMTLPAVVDSLLQGEDSRSRC